MRITSPGLVVMLIGTALIFDLVVGRRALIMTSATTLLVIVILAVMALLLPVKSHRAFT